MTPDFKEQLDALPYGDWHEAPAERDAVWLVQLELDLIDEGQEAAEAYSAVEVVQLRRFLKRWEHLIK